MIKRITKITVIGFIAGIMIIWLSGLKESGLEISRDKSPEAMNVATRIVLVLIAADGSLTIDGESVELTDLSDRVQDIVSSSVDTAATAPPIEYVVAVDDEADNVRVVQVMEALGNGGALKVSISARTD